MAHKKAGGSSRNGRDSSGPAAGHQEIRRRAGHSRQHHRARQRGTKWHPGENVGMGKDHTIFATSEGTVDFRTTRGGRTFISVVPVDQAS